MSGVLVACRVCLWVAASGDSVDENLCRREGLVWAKQKLRPLRGIVIEKTYILAFLN